MPQVAAALTGFFGGLAASAGASAALSAWIGSAAVRLLTSVALGVVFTSLQRAQMKNLPAGIRTQVTQNGGVNPTSFILGTYATAGSMVCPPMSHGTSGKTPNAYLTYVIELADIRGMSVSRMVIDGEYVTLGGTPDADGFYPVQGRFLDYARVKFYNGTQTTADAWLLSTYGSYTSRPWTSDMIGRDQCYAIVVFRYNEEIYNGFPQVRFETTGIPLYDPRLDTTVGGSGSQRWATPSTWAPSNNPMVQAYNIFRGISFADGSVWGGGVGASELPLTEWFAAMNACDVATSLLGGGTEAAYRSGLEVRSNDEPMMVLEELAKAASAQYYDMGGVWKVKVGAVGLSVLSITDDDLIVTKSQDYDPFPNLSDTYNGVTATHPEPTSLYESVAAPIRTSATDEAADGGRRLIADLSLPAVPYKDQVQRLMEAYRLDNRRFRRHSFTLGPNAMLLEPTDALAWTSTANGYTSKIFEVVSITDDLMTGLQRVTVRERDSGDYAWNAATDTKATAPAPGAYVVPGAQAVQSWNAVAVLVTGDVAGVSIPGAKMTWNGVDQDNVDGLKYQIRLVTGGSVVVRGTTTDVEGGEVIVTNSITGNTAYEARGRLVVRGRATSWSSWVAFTTGTGSAVITTDGKVDTPDIKNNAVTNAKAADMPANTLKGNNTGASGDPLDLTTTQVKTMLAIAESDVTNLVTDLAAKAPLASPTFTGDPTGPTASFGDNDTSLATTAFVQALVAYGQLTADYTLSSVVTSQKLFNFSTNGALDLATGRYKFTVMLYLTGMSAAAADNLRFRLGGSGTATLANVWYQTIGQDAAAAMAVGALSGTGSVTAASETNIVSGVAAAEAFVTINGWFNVTAAGTIIPSCNLNTAAAALVKAGSGIIVEYLGPTGSNTKGSWS